MGIARLSPEGLAFIKRYQGFSPVPYRDACHLWVVGYGHVIQDREIITTPLTVEQADALLERDINRCRHMLARALSVPLSQCQYDALLSLAFSVGPQTLYGSALLNTINQGNFQLALTQWRAETELNGVKSNGLNKQRQAECALFASDGMTAE